MVSVGNHYKDDPKDCSTSSVMLDVSAQLLDPPGWIVIVKQQKMGTKGKDSSSYDLNCMSLNFYIIIQFVMHSQVYLSHIL